MLENLGLIGHIGIFFMAALTGILIKEERLNSIIIMSLSAIAVAMKEQNITIAIIAELIQLFFFGFLIGNELYKRKKQRKDSKSKEN